MKAFCDTNILIYAYSSTEAEKAERANSVLFSQPSMISTQVINEFINVGLKKLALSESQLQKAIIELSDAFYVSNFSLKTQQRALDIRTRYKLQYYDSLIVATALENECGLLFSEDMQHGLLIEKRLKIVNPFTDLDC
ncbi:PIN domain-containing protein [Thiomicrospira microaerophila]|uniref:PIN domain-containing protein n=1 Tax=Thiomicrospira microaerophila TaxID=406020 RepID=UPI00200E6D98|nr:PIN domain-containing protein [Thiomicrospira microaerophila]UQB42496.1 PIN domain-containing protein [Thiomicrospira microaerophila]